MTGSMAPLKLDPALFARQNRRLSTSIAIAGLDRLTGLLADDSGDAWVDLQFRQDSGRRSVVNGTVRATVSVICQRCLEPMALELAPDVHVAMTATEEEAETLPDELDPLLCPDGELVLAEFVQDELILALPVIARHEGDSDCRPLTPDDPGGDGTTAGETRENPFAVLGALKGRNGDQGSN